MRSYRCVFSYAGGNTTIDIVAGDGERAIEAASSAISAGDYDRIDVWDGETRVITRTTPRAWDTLGTIVAPNSPKDHPQAPPLPSGLPRRPVTASPARLMGLRAMRDHWHRIVAGRGS